MDFTQAVGSQGQNIPQLTTNVRQGLQAAGVDGSEVFDIEFLDRGDTLVVVNATREAAREIDVAVESGEVSVDAPGGTVAARSASGG